VLIKGVSAEFIVATLINSWSQASSKFGHVNPAKFTMLRNGNLCFSQVEFVWTLVGGPRRMDAFSEEPAVPR